jgi:hypothetical protein
MPSPFSSTFASAAANVNGDSAGNRRENATNEWYGYLNFETLYAHKTGLV